MKAVAKTERKKGALKVIDLEVPQPGPGEVLIRVEYAGICGSDLHAYNYDRGYEFMKIPVILGHEFTGEVVALGEGVGEFKLGERVVAEASQYCGLCANCRSGRTNICENIRLTGLHLDGGMAEYACLDVRYLHKLPEGFSPSAGVLVEPASVAIHAVCERSEINLGESVLIMGPGVIGLLAAQVARVMGAYRVIVVGRHTDLPQRLAWAKKNGFVTICTYGSSLEEELWRLTGQRKVDVVLECSGSYKALAEVVRVVRKGGQVTLVGLYKEPAEIFFTPIVRDEITFSTSYSSRWANYEQAIKLIAEGRLEVESLVETFSLDKALEAFEASLKQEVIKAVLECVRHA